MGLKNFRLCIFRDPRCTYFQVPTFPHADGGGRGDERISRSQPDLSQLTEG